MKNYFVMMIFLVLFALIIFNFYTMNSFGMPDEPENVIIISLNALRADRLSCYGYERNTTPNICKLAEDGVLFENVFSQGTQTPISIASIMSGRYPTTTNVSSWDEGTVSGFRTIPQLLNEAGYSSHFITNYWAYNIERDYIADFDVVNKTEHYRPMDYLDNKESRYLTNTFDSIDFTGGNNLLWIHTANPYYPYHPGDYNGTYVNNYIDVDELYDRLKYIKQNDLRLAKELSDDEIKFISNRYDESLKDIDNRLGNIFYQMKKNNIYNDSLIVIMSDHGEYLGEGGRLFHGYPDMYNIKVPLIVKYPDGWRRGEIIKTDVELVDLKPTISHLIDVEESSNLDGISLINTIENPKERTIRSWTGQKQGSNFLIKRGNYSFVYYDHNVIDFYEVSNYDMVEINKKELPQNVFEYFDEEIEVIETL